MLSTESEKSPMSYPKKIRQIINRCSPIAALLLLAHTMTALSFAQSSAATPTPAIVPAPSLAFDVISIKPNKSGNTAMSHAFPRDGDGMSFTNTPLFMIILFACNADRPGLTPNLPDWTKTERYDLQVKVAESDVDAYHTLTLDQRRPMLQKVLADRFRLQLHRESKEMPVYDLVVAKSGAKLKEATPGETYPVPAPRGRTMFFNGREQVEAQGASMTDLKFFLSDIGSVIDRQVVDKTELTGKYDFTLRFSPDNAATQESPSTADVPSIFTALQEQLGLKLEPAKAPVESLVIDHVERPSEN
jgi:uncharacterized protein (TIGR03435 family)